MLVYIYVHLFLFFLSYHKCEEVNAVDNVNVPKTIKKDHEKIEKKNIDLQRTSSSQNGSVNEYDFKNSNPVWSSKVNSTTVMEGFLIFAGLSIAVVFYFTVKAIRLRRRRCRVRKYGLLTSREDVEMTPLGEEEDDEDSTVFDINDHPHSSTRP